MRFFKRSVLWCSRNKMRMLYIFLIFFVLNLLISITTIFLNTVESTDLVMRKKMGAIFTYFPDMSQKDPNVSIIEPVPVEIFDKLKSDKRVIFSDIISSIYELKSSSLKKPSYYTPSQEILDLMVEKTQEKLVDMPEVAEIFGETNEEIESTILSSLNLYNRNQSISATDSKPSSFFLGYLTLLQGDFFDTASDSTEHGVLISKSYADSNTLSLGATFTLDFTDEDVFSTKEKNTDEPLSKSFEFYVKGIYDVAQDKNDEIFKVQGMEDDILRDLFPEDYGVKVENESRKTNINLDTMYINSKYLFEIEKEILKLQAETAKAEGNEEGYERLIKTSEINYYLPIFILDDPLEVQAFKNDYESSVPSPFILVGSSDTYEKTVPQIQSMIKILSIAQIISFVIALFSISAILFLLVKEQKNDIGILLAMGEKRIKIVLQILFQVFLIFLISSIISLSGGYLIARMTRDHVIKVEQNQHQNDSMNVFKEYRPNLNQEDAKELFITNFNDSFGKSVAKYYMALGAVFIVATLIPTYLILQKKTKDVLDEL